jgi:hypothetical protein
VSAAPAMSQHQAAAASLRSAGVELASILLPLAFSTYQPTPNALNLSPVAFPAPESPAKPGFPKQYSGRHL